MAVSNLTYVYLQDVGELGNEKDSSPIAFSNYNEAMSFGKWVSFAQLVNVTIWNYNGGSGSWQNAVWYPRDNANWP